MKKNMGTVDKVARIVFAIIIAILYFTSQITGVAAIVLGIVAILFLITGLTGVCPGYLPFKLSTLKKSDK